MRSRQDLLQVRRLTFRAGSCSRDFRGGLATLFGLGGSDNVLRLQPSPAAFGKHSLCLAGLKERIAELFAQDGFLGERQGTLALLVLPPVCDCQLAPGEWRVRLDGKTGLQLGFCLCQRCRLVDGNQCLGQHRS